MSVGGWGWGWGSPYLWGWGAGGVGGVGCVLFTLYRDLACLSKWLIKMSYYQSDAGAFISTLCASDRNFYSVCVCVCSCSYGTVTSVSVKPFIIIIIHQSWCFTQKDKLDTTRENEDWIKNWSKWRKLTQTLRNVKISPKKRKYLYLMKVTQKKSDLKSELKIIMYNLQIKE